MGEIVVGAQTGRDGFEGFAFFQEDVDQPGVTAPAHGNGDGHGVGHALNGSGRHGVSHRPPAAEIGEGGAHRHHGFKERAHGGVGSRVPAGGGDADGFAGQGGLVQDGHMGGDLRMDVKAVHGGEALAEHGRGGGPDAARGTAEQNDVGTALGRHEAFQIGEVRETAQFFGAAAQRFAAADDAEALAIRSGQRCFHGASADIPKTVDSDGE